MSPHLLLLLLVPSYSLTWRSTNDGGRHGVVVGVGVDDDVASSSSSSWQGRFGGIRMPTSLNEGRGIDGVTGLGALSLG